MADILLSKPAANAARVVPSAPDTRFVFDFPANAATLSRAGDNLLLTFDDGSSIELTNFYTQYSQEAMPEFVIDGTLVAGADFFNAFGPDLMPAAGPAAGAATRAARYNEFGDSSLMDGINHLDGLDTGFDGAAVTTLDESAVPAPDALSGDGAAGDVVDHGVTIRPVESEVGAENDILRVQEALLGKADTTKAAGALLIDAPDGVADITINGVIVFQNNALTRAPVPTNEGFLDVTGFDPASGLLEYTYTLERSTQEHTEPGADDISHDLSVIVTDTDGDAGSATITVMITDDVPTLTMGSFSGAYGEGINGTVDFDFGADKGEDAKIELSVNGSDNVAGVSTDGGETWTFTVDGKTVTLNAETGAFHYDLPASGSEKEYNFQFTVTDADGDVVSNADPVKVTVERTDLDDVKGSVTGDDDNVLTNTAVSVQMPDLPAGVTLGTGQNVDVKDADGNVYGQLIVDANGNVTFKQTKAYSGEQHNVQGETELATGFSGSLSVTLADGTTSSITVDVSILDDVPIIKASTPSTSINPGESGNNLVEYNEEISFTDGQAGGTVQTTWWNGQVSIHAGKAEYQKDAQGSVIYDGDGKPVIATLTEGAASGYELDYSPYNSNATTSDHGLTVNGGAHGQEIGVSGNGNDSEAVVLDLNGKLAYGVTINFGAFYNGESGAPGQTWDSVSERALVTFYRDGQAVASRLVEGSTGQYSFTLDTSDIVLDGFDKVVISSVDNSENSDFVIQGFDFITKPDNPLIVTTGTVRGESGADGFADGYENAVFDHESGDSYTVVIDGKEYTATLEVTTGSTGDSILTATLDGDKAGDVLFSATLDKDGNWTMEQYEQFQVETDGDGTSSIFELKFETQDSDGDIDGIVAKVPLEVKEQTTTESSAPISNDDDVINIAGGDGVAGTLVAGDTGGVTEGEQVGSSYNVCFVLDTSGSMNDRVGEEGTRLKVATQSIENFIENSIHDGDFVGTVNLAVVPFASKAGSVIEVSITKDAQGERYTLGGKGYDNYADFSDAFETSLGNLKANGGTNYEAGFSNAAAWFKGLGGTNATGNITYFLSDGEPTMNNSYQPANTGSRADESDVMGAWKGYQELLGSADNMQVNAIGFGNDLDDEAMKTLAMLDNTSDSVESVEGNIPANGYLYFENGEWAPSGTKEVYELYEGHVSRNDTYYIQQSDDSYRELIYNDRGHDRGWGYYTGNQGNQQWTPVNVDEAKLYTLGEVPLLVPAGNATQVTDANGLTAAFESGFTPPTLSGAGSDTITAAGSTSSAIIYGDVMNTDELLRELHATLGESGLANSLPAYGSGSAVFDWLEENAGDNALANTVYAGWSQDKTEEYILQHHTELGYETRVGADGNSYLVDLDGNVRNLDGTAANVPLDVLTGRAGGDDAITGSAHNDVIFGQEGNDVILGGAGHDILHGGTGDDLLFGDGDTSENAHLLGDLAAYLEVSPDDPADIMSKIRELNDHRLEELAKKVEAFESPADGNDHLYGGEGDDILFGMGGDDQLFGGSGDDILFGMGGDDYLDGGAGKDKLYGGSGSDILVYDSNDYLVDGGDGIDFLVGKGATDPFLGSEGGNVPHVENIEVIIDTEMDLQSMRDLGDKLGIAVEDGRVTGLDADSGWSRSDTVTAPDGYTAYEHSGGGATPDATILVATTLIENGSN